jgi:alpha-galactosidase
MPILWNPETKEIHLHNDFISYIACIFENGYLGQLYFGPALDPDKSYRHLYRGEFKGFSNSGGDFVRLEYPTRGNGDFRAPALVVEQADGSTVLDPVYKGHRIYSGKEPIPGLPSTYVEDPSEADTIEVSLRDSVSGAEITLYYTIFRDRPIVARSVRVRNSGKKPLELSIAMSASLDLPDADWDLLSLGGNWARERNVKLRHLAQGNQGVSSSRGASSHHQNPFVALGRPGTTEDSGEVYGFGLVYSGNFLADVEVDSFDITRVRLGINPDGFSWRLEQGGEFRTPEAVLAYSPSGLGSLSDAYHGLYRERLARGYWRDRPRPVLINNWEGTYFDFNEKKLLDIAGTAKELGIELFVLDDGWFGERNDEDRKSVV